MHGYLGKILRVHLTTGEIWDEPLNEDYARQFLGGAGLAARYLFDMVGGDTDPLGPGNPLIFMTGPLVGTAMSCSGRFTVAALSPLTGIWGEANSGGFWGPELRFAGYDGIILTGQSPEPVWLSIKDGQAAALHPAADLWGLDSYQTQERLRLEQADPKLRVACIGVAGEKLVKMAGVMNDHGRTAARTGLGAVMGSKRLKAIAVRGQRRVPVADPTAFKQAVSVILGVEKEDVPAQALHLAGTAGYVNMGHMFGDLPIGYYQQGEWEEAENLSGVIMATVYQNRNTGCYRCPIACGHETRAPSYQAEKVDGPEYESLGALGSLVRISNLETVIYANHLCNRHGIDTISLGATIALACELFERGLLTTADTGGIEIRYGDEPTLLSLIEMTAQREGFGDVLAEGSAALAARCGVPELAVTTHKLDVPMHDPRAFSGMAVTYALSPRGACHMQGDMYGVDAGQGFSTEFGVMPGDRFENSPEKGRTAARQMAWRSIYNSVTICQFLGSEAGPLLDALNSLTGWSLDVDSLLQVGLRGLALKRLLNFSRGQTRQDDTLPSLLLKALPSGGTEGFVPDLPVLLSGAYAELGWDTETGLPTPQTLSALGLEGLAAS